VDNSTGSYVFIWDTNPGLPGFYHSGKALRAVNPLAAGAATVDLYADTSYSNVASMKGTQSVGSGGKWTLQTKRNGNTPVDRLTVNEVGLLQHLYASARLQSAVTYSASMTIDATVGDSFIITATNGTAFTINAPTTPITGQRISVKLKNSSGGALGVATWNAVFKMAALTNPADGFSRTIDFEYDGTNWVQISQTGVDVPN
jgi:predicted secreted protein